MGDSDALRQRRYRQHKLGDHSLCVAGRCEAKGGPLNPAGGALHAVADLPREPGGIETAVSAWVATLPYKPGSSRALMAQIAVRLAQRVDETGALPAAVRELRILLEQLAEQPNAAEGPVDEVRLRAAQRRLDAILARAM